VIGDRCVGRRSILGFGYVVDPAPLQAATQIFIDKASGKLASRSELNKALLSANRTGDQLVVTMLDRLGRSLGHLIELSNLTWLTFLGLA
jgi:hypothetical protein